MNRIECSRETPWGIHLTVRNDEDCPRCGWTAPGRGVPPVLEDRALPVGKDEPQQD